MKNYERTMQELCNSIKRPNLQIMSIEEEEVQANNIENISKKTIAQKFPNLRKETPIMYKSPLGHQIDMIKIEPLCGIL
jgi:hypothetical protein